MELSDLSYGSVHEKKEKFISLEARKYIHELVSEVKGQERAYHMGSISKPFVSAFPELDDLC